MCMALLSLAVSPSSRDDLLSSTYISGLPRKYFLSSPQVTSIQYVTYVITLFYTWVQGIISNFLNHSRC